jgi:hypothetical protein
MALGWSRRQETRRFVWDAVKYTQVAELEAHHVNIDSFFATFSLDGKAILTRRWDDGPSWVCSDKNDGEEFFHFRNVERADYEFVAIWTAVPYDTAIRAHPQYSQPRFYSDGWVECPTDFVPSRIWLPADRRSSEMKAVAATGSRVVIGGINGAMTMIALCQ